MAKQTLNFTGAEVEKLLDLVEANKDVVENKKTDRITADVKNKVWADITAEFNATFSLCHRDEKTLRTKYENVKRAAKKNLATQRREVYKTGGGKNNAVITSTDERLLEICQSKQMTGGTSHFDDDIEKLVMEIIANDDSADAINANNVAPAIVEGTTAAEEKQSTNEDAPEEPKKYNGKSWAQILKKTPYKSGQTARDRREDAWTEVAKKKIETLDCELRMAQEEHLLRVKMLKLQLEEQEIKLANLRST